jgi:flagellar motility protein MotE (MotC chaperone)
MGRSKFFSLWGQKAEGDNSDETAEDKKKREDAEAEAAAKKKAEDEEAARKKKNEESGDDDDEDDDEEDEDDEDDKATAEAAAAVPTKVARFIRRAERARLHAIVDGAGPDRVAAALNVALNSNMGAKAAVAMLAEMPVADTTAGRLGLRGSMASRPARPIGSDAAAALTGPAAEVDKAAAGILSFASNAKPGKG